MNAKDEACLWRNRTLVVGEPGTIRGAHLAHAGARFSENFGNAEAATDFDELTARDEDFGAFCNGVQREESGRRTVVDDHRSSRRLRHLSDHGTNLGFQQPQKKWSGMSIARAPFAASEHEFTLAEPRCGLADAFQCGGA